jgi:hypothetical protein
VFNNRALYSEGHGFKSRLGKGLFWLSIFVAFLCPSNQIPR